MIIRRNFHPFKIWPYVWLEVTFTAALSVVLVARGPSWLILPFGPLGVLGTALAIFLGFRSNTGYNRWWEARTIWGGVVNHSRVLARLVISATGNAMHAGKGGGNERLLDYRQEIVLRQIAFAHALRLHLRGQDEWSTLEPYLPPADYARIASARNKPNVLLQIQSDRLKDGVREEMIGAFDPITLEPCLSALNNWQASAERIQQTPMLAQYDFFTRVFLWGFLALLPSSLLSLFPPDDRRWSVLPLAIVISFVYVITSKVGRVTEEPFLNGVHDVPMTALCITIEGDLREQLGQAELPPPAGPIDGYLY